jgi:hypothetical protein
MPRSRALPVHLALVCAALAVASCGADQARLPAPSLDTCRAGWQVFSPPRPFFAPRTLVHHGGELFYQGMAADLVTSQLEALPLSGGPARVVAASAFAWDLWIESEQLFYASGPVLRQVPVAGGTPTVVLGHEPSPTEAYPRIYSHLLTPTALVYTQLGDTAGFTDLWSAPRDGGPALLLATVSKPDEVQRLEVSGGDLLVAGPFGNGAAVPFAGGAPRLLADVGRLSGVDARGVYGFAVKGTFDPTYEQNEMHVAPADGGPAKSFWPDLPPRLAPYALWSDGQDGWVVAALETFDDGRAHQSIFFVDGTGVGTRVACDASTRSEDFLEVAPALTADAAYLVVNDVHDVMHATWSIIKVPRQ